MERHWNDFIIGQMDGRKYLGWEWTRNGSMIWKDTQNDTTCVVTRIYPQTQVLDRWDVDS